MSRRHRRPWIVFGGCVVALALAMAWVTDVVLHLERAEVEARADVARQTARRLAVWRMDSWLSPRLAREAGRAHLEYQAFSGEALWSPSPLLTFCSDLFPVHFQLDAAGRLTSPQVPRTGQEYLADAEGVSRSWVRERQDRLAALEPAIRKSSLVRRLMRAEEQLQIAMGCQSPWQTPPEATLPPPTSSYARIVSNEVDFQNRQVVANAHNFQPDLAETELGPLLPIWLTTADDPILVFARRVRIGQGAVVQGFMADWSILRDELLAQIGDQFPSGTASLTPAPDDLAPDDAERLATVPARFDAPFDVPTADSWTTGRMVLLFAWLGGAIAVVAVGFTLHSTLTLGERRARFASAVTHELRTPLTTFQMYSEMLADGLVTEPGQRADYLATLKRESNRLSRLVENVLCFSRLEEGRYLGRRERLTATELLDRIAPSLRQRAADARMELECSDATADAWVEVDVDAVTQVFFNLVDNAAKYAEGSPRLELTAAAGDRWIELAVRDHGPGIPAEHHRAIFRPFERGGRDAGENDTPGVGLGLALARGLARDLHGELELDPSVRRGARFVLRLPRRQSGE